MSFHGFFMTYAFFKRFFVIWYQCTYSYDNTLKLTHFFCLLSYSDQFFLLCTAPLKLYCVKSAEYRKIRSRKISVLDTFHALLASLLSPLRYKKHIPSLKNVLVFADRCANLNELSRENYQKLLHGNAEAATQRCS